MDILRVTFLRRSSRKAASSARIHSVVPFSSEYRLSIVVKSSNQDIFKHERPPPGPLG
jgi:hypothetical protein